MIEEKEFIKSQIRARDALLDQNGKILFKYSVKKAIHMGNDSLREIEINLAELTISFPNSKGIRSSYDISVVVSVSHTESPNCLLVNLRLADGSLLKEKRWTFSSAEEADKFRKIVNALNAIGPLVKEIFSLIDKESKGYIDSTDLDAAIQNYCRDYPEFTEGSTFLMIDECFTGGEEGKVQLGTLMALMISSNTQNIQSIETLLQEWLSVASERINTLFSYRDSRIYFDEGLEDDDFQAFEYDDELQEFESLFVDQQVSLNSEFSTTTPKSPKSPNDASEPAPKTNTNANANTNTNASRNPDTQEKARASRRRMSVRSLKLSKAIMKPSSISVISKPRGSACTTGSSVTEILSGEIILNTLHQVMFTLGPPNKDRLGFKAYNDGTLLLTNYRIVVAESSQLENPNADISNVFRYGAPPFPTLFSIPLASISRVEVESETVVQFGQAYELAVVCKDLRVLRLAFAGNAVDTFPSFFREVLNSCAFVNSQTDLFCFKATKINANPSILHAALVKEAAVAIMERNRSNTVASSFGSRNVGSLLAIGNNRSKSSDDAQSRVMNALLADEQDSVIEPSAAGIAFAANDSPGPYSYESGSSINRSQSSDSTGAVTHKPMFGLPPPRRTESTGSIRQSRLPSNEGNSHETATMDGWSIFNPAYEYYRQGLLPHPDANIIAKSPHSSRIQSTQINKLFNQATLDGSSIPGGPFWRLWSDGYQLVDTYPNAFILPSALTEKEVFDAAMFRSKCRLPALTWREPSTGACLVRSSQPMSGISSQTNVADKLLLNLYRMRGNPHDPNEQKYPSVFYVVDCRSQLAANANAAMGKGVENWKALVNTRVYFCNIANIHTMRSSLENLHKVLMPWIPSKGNKTSTAITVGGLQILSQIKKAFSGKEASSSSNDNLNAGFGLYTTSGPGNISSASSAATSSSISAGSLQETFSSNNEVDGRFLWNKIEDTGWLEHIRLVIQGSIVVAEKLSLEGCSVLVHCSDGWDRTAQVSSTAQLILDPYFRTIRGFFVLIEKDWCGFGHKFYDRIGHGRSSLGEEAKETSPVFLQWLDVVSQFLFQFPEHFEFSESLLVFIADSLYSCQFGTFLGNSEKERKVDLEAHVKTNSLWTYILQPNIIGKFTNSNYRPHVYQQTPSAARASTNRSPSPAPAARPQSAVFTGPVATAGGPSGSIWPSTRRVRLWERYFCRWDMDFHPRYVCGEGWKDNWC